MKKSELWKQLVAEVGEEEIERAASVTVAEAEAELKAAGFDVAGERAKAEAFLEALENGTLDRAPHDAPSDVPPEGSPAIASDVPSRRARREDRRGPPSAVVLLGTAVVAAAAGAALYASTHTPPQTIAPAPPPSTTPLVPSIPAPDLAAAAEQRRLAAADCDAQQWAECLAYLEQARALDPAGDDAPAVKKLRDKAVAGIFRKPRAP
jgi:hypothetical protein